MSIEHPELGEIRRGYEIGKLNASHKFHQWFACVDCGKPNWKTMTYGKTKSERCPQCAHKIVVKNRIYPSTKGKQGIQPIYRPPIDHEPTTGEIRYSKEIGKGNRGNKYIWYACEVCKKLRWVQLLHNAPYYTKCTICSKIGSIRHKSLSSTRACSKCGKEYPATVDYFYRALRSHKGISRTCKWCRNKQVARNTTKRQRTDPSFRLHTNISKEIIKSLKGIRRNAGWEKLVGYTTKELMDHLESQFTIGMSWENYGKNGWSVDHRIPQCAFSFLKPTDIDFKRCWKLSNLQPLFIQDNCRKGNRVTTPFQPSLPITIPEIEVLYVSK